MINVHLYFLKLFGCMLVEAGDKPLIDIAPLSDAIMNGMPHREVYLQLGRCDGEIGRSNLHCILTEHGHVMAFLLYQLDKIAISVMFAQSSGGWNNLLMLSFFCLRKLSRAQSQCWLMLSESSARGPKQNCIAAEFSGLLLVRNRNGPI